jgi:transcriptional regulator with XRE-family HTH domain
MVQKPESAKTKAPAKKTPRKRADSAVGARPKGKKAPESKSSSSKGGRPTKYNPDLHVALGEAWAAAGKTDKQIAEKLGVSESTLNLWKNEHPEFSESLKRGKAGPDDQVEASLFARATGYSYDSEKLLVVSDGKDVGSHVERLPVVEHCPPDVTACIFWLKNRRPEQWRDRVEHTGANGGPIETSVSMLTYEQALKRLEELRAEDAK